MECMKWCSIASIVFLALSTGLLIACLPNDWLIAEGLEKDKNNTKTKDDWIVIQTFSLELRRMCRINHYKNKGKVCQSIDAIKGNLTPYPNLHKDKVKDAFKYLDLVFVFFITALTATFLALIASVMKAPCVKVWISNVVQNITVVLSITAVFNGMAGVVFFDWKVYDKHGDWMDIPARFYKQRPYQIAVAANVFLQISLIFTLMECFLKPEPPGKVIMNGGEEVMETTAA